MGRGPTASGWTQGQREVGISAIVPRMRDNISADEASAAPYRVGHYLGWEVMGGGL